MKAIELIESFYQGPKGNCVSIACVKAAIAKWGTENVLAHYASEADGGFSFQMRDGFSSRVRGKELSKARAKSGFLVGDNELVHDWAQKYFAAMAKRVLVEGEIDVFFSLNAFNGAIRSLNNGEGYYEGVKWLGLKNNNSKVDGIDSASVGPLVVASNPHCFFAWDGYYDRYGDAIPFGQIGNEGEAFKARYCLMIV